MKKLFLLALCSSLLIFATNSYSGSADEICSTWVNTNYTSGDPPQKLIFHFDGTFACYDTQKTSNALKRGTYSIDEKWQDSEGNIWYKIKMREPMSITKYKLAKISDDGNILEFICNTNRYPATLSLEDEAYCKYSRY